MILGLAVLQVVRKKCDSLKSTPAPEDWTFESSDMEDLRGIGFNPSKDEWKEVKADAKKWHRKSMSKQRTTFGTTFLMHNAYRVHKY
jgi:hypothetical protein